MVGLASTISATLAGTATNSVRRRESRNRASSSLCLPSLRRRASVGRAAEAMAKVDFRLVPNQSAEQLLGKLKQHLIDQGFGDIEVIQHGGYDAARVDPDAPFVQMVADTAWDVYDRPVSLHPSSGGSGPMASFVKHLGMPIANVGIAHPETNAHAPNERVLIEEFKRGIKQTARVYMRMNELRD